MHNQTLVVIPSRLAAQRFNRKPLALIHGQPMIVHVWKRAIAAQLGPVVVACCSHEVKGTIEAEGGTAILTDPHLPSGSDRVAEATQKFDPQEQFQNIINLQGDLPTIQPKDIQRVEKALLSLAPDIDISTLACPILSETERTNPNCVKVVIGNMQGDMGQAFYFSRTPVFSGHNKLYHHIGVYGFKRKALRDFVNLPPSALEQQESLEQLRALEAGFKFGIHLTSDHIFGVDAPEDIAKAESVLLKNATDYDRL